MNGSAEAKMIEIPFQSPKGNTYNIEVRKSDEVPFSIGPRNRPFFALYELYSKVYPYRDPNLSLERVVNMLSHPRTLLMMAKFEGQYVGFGVFPRFEMEECDVMYSSRGVVQPHEAYQIGPRFLDLGIQMHNEELRKDGRRIEYVALYTQNPVSAASADSAEYMDNIRPFRRSLNKAGGLYVPRSVPQRIMHRLSAEVLTNTTEVNLITGVCTSELADLGPNQSYVPGKSGRVDGIFDEMTNEDLDKGLGMKVEKGDVVIVIADALEPNLPAIF